MYDDMIQKIFEAYMRVIHETKKNVWLEIRRDYIFLNVIDGKWDRGPVSSSHSAWISNISSVTENDLQEIYDTLMFLLKDGAVGV